MRSWPAVLLGWLLLLGSGCTGETAGAPDITLTPSSLDFGPVSVGLDSTRTVTVTNAGGGSLELLSLTLTEGSPAVFAVSRDPATSLAAGESIDVTVVFTPNNEGEARGRIQIRSTDADSPSLLIPLVGEGGPSVIDGDGDGYSAADGDCNDNNPDMFPGNPEVCDGRDNDCDGALLPDEGDDDGDGVPICDGDCDDTEASIYPGAPEICDDADSDCDGINADNADTDLDGFTPCEDDCDDAEPDAFPGNPEVCDGVDNDCSEVADDLDADGDGHSPCSVGGDCDDDDPAAFPVVVDAAAGNGGDGTDAAPFDDLGEALGNLDAVCRTVALLDGSYSFSDSFSSGVVRFVGQSREGVVVGPDGGRFLEVSGNAEVTVQRMTLSGFSAAGDGGALTSTNASITLLDATLDGNQATGDGGAVAVFTGELTLQDVTFVGNAAGDDGGAVALVSSSVTDLGGNLFEGNSGVRGGALVADGSLVALDGSAFYENSATDDGGALMLIGAPSMSIQRIEVFGNSAGLTGGGLAINNTTSAASFVRNCAIRDNQSGGAGGGLYVGGSVAGFVIANNTLTGNVGVGEGGGIRVDANSSAALFAASNIVGWSGGSSGFSVRAGVGGTYLSNTAFGTGAVGADFAGDVAAGTGENTVVNPQFQTFTPDGDPYNDSLALQSSSPMIDSGLPESLAPAAYPSWNDTDSSPNDRGATGGPYAP